jgi:hypothetical protein
MGFFQDIVGVNKFDALDQEERMCPILAEM